MNLPTRCLAAVAFALVGCSQRGAPAFPADLRERPAVDLILSAFENHSLVALSEGAGHGQLETRDLFRTLIRDNRFRRTVRHIVVEFGNARHQEIVDRYVSGESVARDELRHVWEDTTQVSGTWSLPMYEQML